MNSDKPAPASNEPVVPERWREIKLTSHDLSAMVSEWDYEELSRWEWYAFWNKTSRAFYAARSDRDETGKTITVFMHRQLLGLVPGDGIEGDHRSGYSLDNRRGNLRVATKAQNQANRGPQINNRSGYKGVSWKTERNQWMVMICRDKKRYFLGNFDDPKLGALVYNWAALMLHGEFARLNEVVL